MDKLNPKIGERKPYHYRRRKEVRVENTKGKQPKGRNVGKLMQVMNLPVDVFLEIASHLQPLDVLHLSRVSIELRETLMSRKMRSIWVAARNGMDPRMPECPEGLSEPRYASLVFETQCMACGAGRALWKYSFAAHVRFCGACWKANIRPGSKLAKEAGITKDGEALDVVFNLLPQACEYVRWRRGELEQHARMKFYEPEFNAAIEQYKNIRSAKDTQGLQDFIARRRAETVARLEFDSAVRVWQVDHSDAKEKAENETACTRAAAIKLRLEELGYHSNDLPIRDAEFDKILHQPRPLTSMIWNKIQPKLIKILEETRVRREEEAFRLKWHSRLYELETYYQHFVQNDCALHPEKRTLPNFQIARRLPCMAALLTSTEDPQEHLTQEQFAAIEAALLQQAEENYRIPTVHFLADLVRKAMEKEAQAATTGKGKGSKKAKVTVKEPVHKGKGKKPAIRDDSDSEIGTDIGAHSSTSVDEALLKSLTSTFECRDCIWLTPGAKYMTCNELLAHWQSSHVVQPWESEFVRVSPSEDMPRLLSALRLPPEATLPDIEQVLSASSAMPECSQCNRRMSPRSWCLGTMLCHIKNAHRTPLGDPYDEPGMFIDLGNGSSDSVASGSQH